MTEFWQKNGEIFSKIFIIFASESLTMKKTIDKLTKDLVYISETDAPIIPFTLEKAAAVTAAEVLRQTGNEPGETVDTIDPDTFFDRLTAIREWYGPREKRIAGRFEALKVELEEELADLKVFKIGKIRIEIYVVGLDKKGRLAGVKTNAVET